MEIFLVRHGETGGNIAHRHQAEDTPLTEKGKRQAQEAAAIIKKYEPTHLVTSTLVRAIETATVIGEECDLIPETNNLFIELERPQKLHGHFHKSPRSLFFYMQWYLGRTSDAEGESYSELRQRIIESKKALSEFPEDARVIVVTHSVFMSLFLAHTCREEMLTPLQAAGAFRTILKTRNTHIAPILFNPDAAPNTCAWTTEL